LGGGPSQYPAPSPSPAPARTPPPPPPHPHPHPQHPPPFLATHASVCLHNSSSPLSSPVAPLSPLPYAWSTVDSQRLETATAQYGYVYTNATSSVAFLENDVNASVTVQFQGQQVTLSPLSILIYDALAHAPVFDTFAVQPPVLQRQFVQVVTARRPLSSVSAPPPNPASPPPTPVTHFWFPRPPPLPRHELPACLVTRVPRLTSGLLCVTLVCHCGAPPRSQVAGPFNWSMWSEPCCTSSLPFTATQAPAEQLSVTFDQTE
jgi:hypothetical protein